MGGDGRTILQNTQQRNPTLLDTKQNTWTHKKECTELLYYSGETFQRSTAQINSREGRYI